MVDEQTVTRYSAPAIVAHWLVALLIIANILIGLIAEKLPDEQIRFAVDTHKSIGATVLGLIVLRLLWRLGHRPPPFSEGLAGWERALAHITHFGLYVLMFAMPLSGWLHDSAWKAAPEIPMRWFGLFEWPRFGFIMNLPAVEKEHLHGLFGEIHEIGGYILIALVLLHLAGALKHQLIDHKSDIRRMWFR